MIVVCLFAFSLFPALSSHFRLIDSPDLSLAFDSYVSFLNLYHLIVRFSQRAGKIL